LLAIYCLLLRKIVKVANLLEKKKGQK